VPKSQIVSKGDAICAKGQKTVTAQPPQFDPRAATPAQLRSAVPFLRQQANAIRNDVDQIAALGKPDKDAVLLARLLADTGARARPT